MLGWLVWWRPPCVLRSVIVNLKDDHASALRGVFWQARGPWFTLTRAELLKAGASPTALVGEVLVHRDNVSFMQVLPPNE